MPAFFLAFLSVALVTLAGRDAVRVARLRVALGDISGLWFAIAFAAIGGCALAAWLAGEIAPLLGPAAKALFAALALALAALEAMLLRPPERPAEPTRSTGAITLVLFAGVLTDATGFLVLAISAATSAPLLAGAGAALGAGAVLAAACWAGEDWEKLPLPFLRAGVGMALLASASVIALIALEIL